MGACVSNLKNVKIYIHVLSNLIKLLIFPMFKIPLYLAKKAVKMIYTQPSIFMNNLFVPAKWFSFELWLKNRTGIWLFVLNRIIAVLSI